MREIYLVRHAIATERGESWPDDTKRPLTRDGIRRFKEAVKGLRSIGVEPDLVLTSPLTRARQTAELLSAGLSGRPPIEIVDALAPGGAPGAIVSALRRLRVGSVALVGHEPDLGHLASVLLGSGGPLAFKKGGVCRIDLARISPRPGGTLAWLATPRLLRLGSA